MKETDPKTVALMNEINERFGKVELNHYNGPAGQYGEKTV